MRGRDIAAAAAGALGATVLAASVAWAAIPGDDGVYSACMLKNLGTVRLIDKSLPPGNLMSHCKTAFEVEISWGEQGPQGLPGSPGPAGADGEDGNPFSGTFTSPNGEYSITVADDGITLAHGSSAAIRLTGANVIIESGNAIDVTSSGNATLSVGGSLAAQSGSGTTVDVGGALRVAVDGNATLDTSGALATSSGGGTSLESETSLTARAGGNASFFGSQLGLNASGPCPPAARVGDTVGGNVIASGSATVCIG